MSKLSHGYIPAEDLEGSHPNSDTPQFTYAIERITGRDIQLNQVEHGKLSTCSFNNSDQSGRDS
jgi:hypothetical protein